MKLNEFKKEPEIINRDEYVPRKTTHLNYYNTIVTGDFNCSRTHITSLEGSPLKVGGYYSCYGNLSVSSLEGITRNIGGAFFCDGTNITNLKNIHKYIDRIGGELVVPAKVSSHILGVLKIRGVDHMDIGNEDLPAGTDPEELLQQAVNIINKYLEDKPNPSQRDIHGCQIEMIEAGLGLFAQL